MRLDNALRPSPMPLAPASPILFRLSKISNSAVVYIMEDFFYQMSNLKLVRLDNDLMPSQRSFAPASPISLPLSKISDSVVVYSILEDLKIFTLCGIQNW